MKNTKVQQSEEDLIAFFIDPDSFSADEKKRLAASFHKDISKWETLTGRTAVLSQSRYQKIRAAFWSRTESAASMPRTLCYTATIIVTAVLLYFVFAPTVTPVPDMASTSDLLPLTEDYFTAESFENFTDSLMPVAPLPDAEWFGISTEPETENSLLEDLLTLTSPEGELS